MSISFFSHWQKAVARRGEPGRSIQKRNGRVRNIVLYNIAELGVRSLSAMVLRPRHVWASVLGAFEEGVEELGVGFSTALEN